jgi:hypothetical protein
MRTTAAHRHWPKPGISRFPSKELLHMPGSSTTPGRPALAMTRQTMLPSTLETVSAPGNEVFGAQCLAYALPYRRFAVVLADANARLGADVDR